MASGALDTTTDPRFTALLRMIDDLPTVPETLVRIWQIVDDPLSTSETLADVVRLDAPLSIKVLRLANSPYYSTCGQSIADIGAAVSVLGFEAIKQLAICVSVATNLVRDHARRRGGPDYRALWRHSVVAGVTGKRLALMIGDPNPDEVFTAGLLHDLGKFALLCAMAGPYAEVIAARRQAGCALVEVETARFGFDHAAAGAAFGRSWHFPELLTEGARCHHDRFLGARDDDRLERVRLCVALADRVAHRIDPPACDLGFVAASSETGPLLLRLGLNPGAIDEQMPTLREDLQRAHAYLEIV
ncbi:MAG: HDOD domain-containing protein [Candidatus Krumholzibacteriia bacterium]